ncbi:MAG: hypothetical protein ABF868_06285 [Sporolactobacillus sp.]
MILAIFLVAVGMRQVFVMPDLLHFLIIVVGVCLLLSGLQMNIRASMQAALNRKFSARLSSDERESWIQERSGWMTMRAMNLLLVCATAMMVALGVSWLFVIGLAGLLIMQFVLFLFFGRFFERGVNGNKDR